MYQHPLSQHSMPRNQSSARPAIRGCTLSTRASATQRRREHIWAWASALLLVLCWDASLRLDQKLPLPRVRLAHAADLEPELRGRFEER